MRWSPAVLLALLLVACPDLVDPGTSDGVDAGADTSGDVGPDSGIDAGTDTGPTFGQGIFLEGCPTPGKAYAKQILAAEARMHGPHVMAGQGDWLLMNEVAAFAITDPIFRRTYWYYDGILVDAVAVEGCEQAGEERFEELVPVVAQVELADFPASIMRGFHVDYLEVLQDGSDGGDAIIRAHGTDDLFWLIDQVFAEARFKAGNGDGLSKPLGLELWVDYILAPGSRVLTIRLGAQNIDPAPKELGSATVLWVGDTTNSYYYADSEISFGGYSLDIGVPWFASESFEADGAYAVALDNSATGTTRISGVQAILNIEQAFAMPVLGPMGEPDDSITWDTFVAVGPTDGNSATRELITISDQIVAGEPFTLETVTGTVIDAVGGGPVADVTVRAEKENSNGSWRTIDLMRTRADGTFSAELAYFGVGDNLRLVAEKLGMPTAEAVPLALPNSPAVQISLGRAATLQLDIRDPGGAGMPARVMLYDATTGSEKRRILSATGGESFLVAPGNYEVSVMKGIEFSISEQTITLTADQTTTLAVTIERLVDTTGFLLMDSHIHAAPSPDSRVLVDTRVLTAAADGCEVPVNTDHEFILDYQPTVVAMGLEKWVRQVTGEEVTPTLPEHINMFPVVPTTNEDARGGIVKWYGLDIDQIYAAIDARGAGITQLNHPRNGCNYLCTIGYDRITGMPSYVPDPTLLGFDAGAKMWSWNFDAIELMNSFKNIWMDPTDPDDSGLFDDWQSFFNLGHRITAMGVTDTHGMNPPCQPGTYFASSTDDPSQLNETEMVENILAGRALVTTGAFAWVTVNGTAAMGDTVTDQDGTVDVDVKIQAIPQIDVAYFKVFVNCDQVATIATTSPDAVVKYDSTVSVPVTVDANLIVVGFGVNPMPRGFRGGSATTTARFITNPIFVDVDGNGDFDAPGGKTCTYDLNGP